MHVHTRRSHDCLTDAADVLAAATERGVTVLCITDHNEIAGALELKRRHPDRIIVGEEVRTQEGVDIIGLFLRDRIAKGTPALETCALIHKQGGLVYVPHPFAPGKGGDGALLEKIAPHVDAIEGFNARLHDPALNERAQAWGSAHGVAVGAGSDAHTAAEVGRAYAEVPRFDDSPAAFLRALRSSTIHGRASSRAVHLASTWARLRKRFD